MVLAAFGITSTAVVGNDLLRSYLLHETDQRLVAASVSLDDQGLGPGMMGNGGGPSRLPNELVFLVMDAQGHLIATPNTQGDLGGHRPPDIAGITYDRAIQLRGRPFTTATNDGGGEEWRAVARPVSYPGGVGSIVIATSLRDVDATLGHLQTVEVLTGVGVLFLLALLGFAVVRLTLRPLTAIEETAEAIGAGNLSRRVPDAPAHTEVGRLAAALNAMLTQIEQAAHRREESEGTARASEARMRRFVADASHELRTPLTSIRGFAELARRQGETLDATALDRMLGRIEDESTRMGSLVEDLLHLARLDQRAPVTHRTVELAPILTDAAFDARTLSPERPIALHLPEADLVVSVSGDEAQLREVVGNLVGNALRHTPATTPIQLSLGVVDVGPSRFASLEVSDAGPGMDASDASRVFERFYRADPARGRAQGSTGLGLAIVAAIVEAHEGRIELFTAPGEGARFRVLLPLASEAGT